MHELGAALISIYNTMTELNCHMLYILLNAFGIPDILIYLYMFIYKLNVSEI